MANSSARSARPTMRMESAGVKPVSAGIEAMWSWCPPRRRWRMRSLMPPLSPYTVNSVLTCVITQGIRRVLFCRFFDVYAGRDSADGRARCPPPAFFWRGRHEAAAAPMLPPASSRKDRLRRRRGTSPPAGGPLPHPPHRRPAPSASDTATDAGTLHLARGDRRGHYDSTEGPDCSPFFFYDSRRCGDYFFFRAAARSAAGPGPSGQSPDGCVPSRTTTSSSWG